MGKIYLEPRSKFDSALIDTDNIIYDYDLIIQVLMKSGMTYMEAREFYEFNIQCLHYQGLCVHDDNESICEKSTEESCQ